MSKYYVIYTRNYEDKFIKEFDSNTEAANFMMTVNQDSGSNADILFKGDILMVSDHIRREV